MTDRNSFTKRALIVAAVAVAAVVLLFMVWHLAQMLLLIFAGILLAILLDGLSGRLTGHVRMPRPLALAVVVVALFAILSLAGWVIGPRITDQLTRLADRVPEAIDSLEQTLSHSEWGRKILDELPTTRDLVPMGSALIGRITGIFSTAFGVLGSAVLILFVGIYMAVNPRVYTQNIIRLIPKDKRERAQTVTTTLGVALRWWLAGRIASLFVVGILTALGLWIAGVPLALTLGLIAGLISFIPLLGPILSIIPAILVALADDPIMIIWVLLIYGTVQFLESYFITPMIQQEAVSMPPALLITVVVLMGVLFGIIGMLLATPLTLVIIVLIQMLYVEDVLGDEVKIAGTHTK